MYLEQYLKCIQSFYPSLNIESVQWNHFGENNDILFLNKKWVFRFPKHEEAKNNLQTEYEQLLYINPYISLPIPEPVFINTDTNILGQAFFGYPLIPGIPLYRETVQSLSPSVEETLIHDLATFLYELHSIPVVGAPGKVIANNDAHHFWTNMFERITGTLFSYIRVEKQEEIVNHFTVYLNNQSNFSFKPTIIHGDFANSNILFDEQEQQLSGVIDFGKSYIGDPAIDFAGLYKRYGVDLVKRIASFYPGIEEMMPRIQFYAGAFSLQRALHGFHTQNREILSNSLKEYV
ncbi:aminoglycoside phosphotransferase family protein [Pseudalkalibacillus sp. SCS-8]|uniref:phosphotransferase family protein n=1 Tax=Pseudalkalibacillus nanhaiensis TaxID=3115291 RepID=UPI0032DA55AB